MKKEKVKRLLAVLVSAGMVAGMMAGCGTEATSTSGSGAAATPETSSSGASSAASSTSSSSAAAASSTDESSGSSGVHEIYTVSERNNLSGVVNPDMKSRADIDKALPEEQKGGLVIGLSMGQMGSSFFTQMHEAAKAKCEEYGYELVMFNADGNISQQSADVEAMITNGVDAIILNPMDVIAAEADVKRAVEAGIPVIGCGVDFATDVPVITSVLANNFFGGWESGVYVGDFFEGQHIKAGMILGVMGHTIDESRMTGMMAGIVYERAAQQGNAFASEEDAYMEAYNMFNELRDNGKLSSEKWDFEVVAVNGDGAWTNEGGLAATEDIIAGNPDINLIMTGSDPMGAGAIKAIKDSGLTPGKDIYVACCADGGQEMFPYLESGEMLCTGYNSPDLTATAGIDLIHMIFEEGYDASNLPAAEDLPTGVITQDNWKDYYDPDLQYCKVLDFKWETIDEIRAEAGLD